MTFTNILQDSIPRPRTAENRGAIRVQKRGADRQAEEAARWGQNSKMSTTVEIFL